MRRLEAGKTGWIKSATVDFCKQGSMRGILMVEVTMGGDASRGSFDEVAAFVEQLMATRLPPSRIVRFSGNLVDGDVNFTLLVKSLFDYGYAVQCVIDDRLVYSWQQWMSWIIVRAVGRVVMTQANEIWYVGETLPDTVVFPQSRQPTFCFVGGRLGVDEVDEFVCRQQGAWGLL